MGQKIVTLSQAKLSDMFKSLTPTTDYTVAAARISSGFQTYFAEATVLGIGIGSVGLLAPCKAAMDVALLAAMAPRNNAAGAFQSGITAWWGAVPAVAAVLWVGEPPMAPPVLSATPPPGLSGIAAALSTVFAANRAGGLNLPSASDAIAAVLHPLMLGGLAGRGPPPSSSPIL